MFFYLNSLLFQKVNARNSKQMTAPVFLKMPRF
jgi:hypothetical protein